jgi:hypothetical protein
MNPFPPSLAPQMETRRAGRGDATRASLTLERHVDPPVHPAQESQGRDNRTRVFAFGFATRDGDQSLAPPMSR